MNVEFQKQFDERAIRTDPLVTVCRVRQTTLQLLFVACDVKKYPDPPVSFNLYTALKLMDFPSTTHKALLMSRFRLHRPLHRDTPLSQLQS